MHTDEVRDAESHACWEKTSERPQEGPAQTAQERTCTGQGGRPTKKEPGAREGASARTGEERSTERSGKEPGTEDGGGAAGGTALGRNKWVKSVRLTGEGPERKHRGGAERLGGWGVREGSPGKYPTTCACVRETTGSGKRHT